MKTPTNQAPQGTVLTDAQRQLVHDAVAEAIGSAYDCIRVWSAWSYNTMGPDDFLLVAEDESRVAEIADAAINALLSEQPAAAPLQDAKDGYLPPLPESSQDGDKTCNYFGKLYKYTDNDMREYAIAAIAAQGAKQI